MAKSRIDLQNTLEEILGSRQVYFQPPSSIIIKYPAIVYNLSNIKTEKADNINYKKDRLYTLTLIHKDPDNDILEKLLDLPYCKMDSSFVSDGLNHYVFSLVY